MMKKFLRASVGFIYLKVKMKKLIMLSIATFQMG